MRIGVGFLFDGPVQALEVLLDQKLHAGLGPGLDANPVALRPVGHLMHRDRHPDCASIKGRGHGLRVWRALQKIDKRTARGELNARCHKPAVAAQGDFLLREPQPQRISLNAKFHMRPTIRRLPEYTLNRSFLRKPISVMPDRPAVATARLEGAPTAAITGMPAISAFCTSSKLARPLTNRSDAFIGMRRSNSAAPTSLSTALCRPTSSRRHSNLPPRSKRAAACSPPVLSKILLKHRGGTTGRT